MLLARLSFVDCQDAPLKIGSVKRLDDLLGILVTNLYKTESPGPPRFPVNDDPAVDHAAVVAEEAVQFVGVGAPRQVSNI